MRCIDCPFFEVRDKTDKDYEPYCKKYKKAHVRNSLSLMPHLMCIESEKHMTKDGQIYTDIKGEEHESDRR